MATFTFAVLNVLLHKATRDSRYLRRAERIAEAIKQAAFAQLYAVLTWPREL
ncbi:hypothetical protein [Streptomyces lutosisoli]|uniref:Transposase n=1 Tax=Streptomyces lutosisoli TaxID=2665721 RepID=A0ABW2VZ33_9ACTN